MKKNAEKKMLEMLASGRIPNMESLKLGKEEFVLLVSKALSEGLIAGVYVSFCDNENVENLLASAVLTEKGKAQLCKKHGIFRR